MKPAKNFKSCDICEERATSLCFNCFNYFCDSCFKFVHDKKPKSEHKKDNIDPFVPIDIKCPEHPNNPMNLFCLDERGKIYFLIIHNRTMLYLLLL